jgi:large subunit ribosomal protein L20
MRVKTGARTKQRHNKVLELAKGYWMSRSKLYRKAHEAVLHAGKYAYVGRKQNKRNFRTLWIIRINAAVRELGLSYSQFIAKLAKANVTVDRKILAQIATEHPKVFEQIVKKVQ